MNRRLPPSDLPHEKTTGRQGRLEAGRQTKVVQEPNVDNDLNNKSTMEGEDLLILSREGTSS
jgi:hypothetical protein